MDLFFKKSLKYRTAIELSFALFIFALLFVNGKLLEDFSFFGVVTAFLSFIILVEVIRMVGQYVITNHISVTLMIDTVIIFVCRDILLTLSHKTYSFEEKTLFISLFLFVLCFFFFFRGKTIEHSKSKDCLPCSNCEKKGLL